MGKVARALTVLRREGARSFAFRLVEALWLYRRLDLVQGPPPRRNEKERIPLAIGTLGASDLDAYLALRPDQARAAIEARLAAGELCLVAHHEGRLVAATWIALDRVFIEHVGRTLELAEDAFYGYDTFVAPECRGQRVADALAAHRGRVLEPLGRTTGVALFWPENLVSRHRRARRGYWAPVGRLVSYGLGPWQRCVLRFEAGAEPAVRLVGRGDPGERRAAPG